MKDPIAKPPLPPRDPPLRLVEENEKPSKRPRDWRAVQWMTVGIGVKRWGVGAIFGLLLSIAGAILASTYVAVDLSIALMYWVHGVSGALLDPVALGVILLVAGVLLVAICLRGTLRSVEGAFMASGSERGGFLETALQQRKLQGGAHIVVIGGGTGLSTMLRGLRDYSSNITAVVTMADDGGSSGMLREGGMQPPGDIRNCIAALAEAEPTVQSLFQHRFEGLGPLAGHSLGNLFFAGMWEMTGSFSQAVEEVSKALAIRGRVLPSTLEDVRLGARLKDGSEIVGQVNVNKSRDIEQVFLLPESPQASPGAVEAIRDAEIIIIGPGSLYTSIIPNLLVPEIAAAIQKATAPKLYVCNVMTQPGETTGYKASDHVRAIIRHIGQGVLTHAALNSGRVAPEVLERYRESGADFVAPDAEAVELLGVRPLRFNFVNSSDIVRHNPQRLASFIFRTIGKM